MNNYRKENRTLEVLLKVFLAVGIVAGICVIVKVLYDKYKSSLCMLCDDDCDCNFECLDGEGFECDCDNCEFAKSDDSVAADAVVEEVPAEN